MQPDYEDCEPGVIECDPGWRCLSSCVCIADPSLQECGNEILEFPEEREFDSDCLPYQYCDYCFCELGTGG